MTRSEPPSASHLRKKMIAINRDFEPHEVGVRSTITLVPQEAFRGQRLVITSAAAAVNIHDIFVGNKSQLAGVPAAGLPGALFSPLAPDPGCCQFDTARLGEAITIIVTAKTTGTFTGWLIGDVVDWTDEYEEPAVTSAKLAIKEIEEAYEPFSSDEIEDAFKAWRRPARVYERARVAD